MSRNDWAFAAWAVVGLTAAATPAAAGPVSVFTEVYQADGSSNDEIPVAGLGLWARLTTGGGLNNAVTVPADQTAAHQAVVGYWPVMQFRDQAQYEAERGTVVAVPETAVRMYAEVWDGGYGSAAAKFQSVQFDAVVSARVSPDGSQNSVEWRLPEPVQRVQFDDAVVTVRYETVPMPPGIPQIQFPDGSLLPGTSGSIYYPTVLEAWVDVERPQTGDPGEPVHDSPATPEPTSAVLLGGFLLGGWVMRRTACRLGA